jgi:hypothetical protein
VLSLCFENVEVYLYRNLTPQYIYMRGQFYFLAALRLREEPLVRLEEEAEWHPGSIV